MNIRVRYGNERGVDIEAQFPDTRRWIFIEVKGERSGSQKTAQQRAALGEALLQIFNVYDSTSVCAIALPNTRGFQKLIRNIFLPLSRLRIHVLFIGEDGEIWHAGPTTPAGLPRRISSLREALQ